MRCPNNDHLFLFTLEFPPFSTKTKDPDSEFALEVISGDGLALFKV